MTNLLTNALYVSRPVRSPHSRKKLLHEATTKKFFRARAGGYYTRLRLLLLQVPTQQHQRVYGPLASREAVPVVSVEGVVLLHIGVQHEALDQRSPQHAGHHVALAGRGLRHFAEQAEDGNGAEQIALARQNTLTTLLNVLGSAARPRSYRSPAAGTLLSRWRKGSSVRPLPSRTPSPF